MYVVLIFVILIIDLQYFASCLGLELCLASKSIAMTEYLEFKSLSFEIQQDEIK